MRAAVMIVALGTAALAGCGARAVSTPGPGGPVSASPFSGSAVSGGTGSGGTGSGSTGTAASAGVLVTGRLVMEGGPMRPGGQQPPVRPIRGTVTFTAGHRAVTATVPASGLFSVRLAPGTYRATAVTPNINGPGDPGSCPQPSPVRVGSSPLRVTVACIVP